MIVLSDRGGAVSHSGDVCENSREVVFGVEHTLLEGHDLGIHQPGLKITQLVLFSTSCRELLFHGDRMNMPCYAGVIFSLDGFEVVRKRINSELEAMLVLVECTRLGGVSF